MRTEKRNNSKKYHSAFGTACCRQQKSAGLLMLLRDFLQVSTAILHNSLQHLTKPKTRKKAWNRRFKPEKSSNNAGNRCGVHVWRPLLYQLSYTPKYVIAANERVSLAENIITQTRVFVKMFSGQKRGIAILFKRFCPETYCFRTRQGMPLW